MHEVPFHFFPRKHGSSKIRIVKVGMSFMKLLAQSWRWRNSVESCDYDARAYDSLNLPQRYWQRTRYKLITDYGDRNGKVLDLGCGSSRIFESLPLAVGVDVNMKKLRYRRPLGKPLICASVNHVPMKSESFDQVICAEVIEHIPEDEGVFRELHRVLKPGGTLVLGTPDYSRWQWNLVEWLYGKLMLGGYADEHITHYTYDSLVKILDRNGFDYLDHTYSLQGDLIIKARKRK